MATFTGSLLILIQMSLYITVTYWLLPVHISIYRLLLVIPAYIIVYIHIYIFYCHLQSKLQFIHVIITVHACHSISPYLYIYTFYSYILTSGLFYVFSSFLDIVGGSLKVHDFIVNNCFTVIIMHMTEMFKHEILILC